MCRFTRIFVVLLAVMIFSISFVSLTNAGDYTMRIASATSTRFAASGVMEIVKEALEQATYGRIEVKIFPAGQLGGESSLIEKCQTNQIQATPSSAPVAMSLEPKMGVVALPFVINTRDKLQKFYESDLGQEMLMSLDDRGLVGLDYIPWGPTGYLTKKPVRTLEDMSKIRFRVTDSPIWLDTFRALGVDPVVIPFPDAYSALQRGVTEGADNPPETLEAAKFYEVAKYYTEVTPFFSQTVFFVNKKWLNSLPEDLRQVTIDVVRKSCSLARVIEEYHQDWALNKMVEEHGVEIIELPLEEREKFVDATKPVVKEYMGKMGKDYVTEVFKLVGYDY